jgi:hypothetical protein
LGGVLGRFNRAGTSGRSKKPKEHKKISLVKYEVCNSTSLNDIISLLLPLNINFLVFTLQIFSIPSVLIDS